MAQNQSNSGIRLWLLITTFLVFSIVVIACDRVRFGAVFVCLRTVGGESLGRTAARRGDPVVSRRVLLATVAAAALQVPEPEPSGWYGAVDERVSWHDGNPISFVLGPDGLDRVEL